MYVGDGDMKKTNKKKSKKLRVQTPEMGVVSDLMDHGKKLIKKHGPDAVSKVGKHLESYAHGALSKGVDHVSKKVKEKLPAQLHKHVDRGASAAKEFGQKQATKTIHRGVSQVTGAINKK